MAASRNQTSYETQNEKPAIEMTDNEIMTLEEVAAYLKLKPQTIYTWAQEKKIPAAKLGKEWRFKRSIIDRWINQHFAPIFSNSVNGPDEKGKKERA